MRRTPVRGVVVMLVGVAAAARRDRVQQQRQRQGRRPRRDEPRRAPAPGQTLVFNGQGNDLGAYLAEPPFTKQLVDRHNDDETTRTASTSTGRSASTRRTRTASSRARTRTRTPTGHPGWGIFELSGTADRQPCRSRRVGKLVPTYQPSNDNPENYGCGFLDDGRILTTDVGNQAVGPRRRAAHRVVPAVRVAQGEVLQGRRAPDDRPGRARRRRLGVRRAGTPSAAVFRYDGRRPADVEHARAAVATGRTQPAHRSATNVTSTLFIRAREGRPASSTPSGSRRDPTVTCSSSSVFNGVIARVHADGKYVRDILKPPAGEQLGAKPFSTGTPLGVGVGPDGSVYYADIGIVATADGIGPGDGTGKVRRIALRRAGQPAAARR